MRWQPDVGGSPSAPNHWLATSLEVGALAAVLRYVPIILTSKKLATSLEVGALAAQ